MLLLIREPVTHEQIDQMAQEFYGLRIKLAVDVAREILAGGGALHYDCEQVLLTDGSQQQDVWGADWYPTTRIVEYDSLINLRPQQGNRSTELLDLRLRAKIKAIIYHLLEVS